MNLSLSFLELQENILVQQNNFLQQNKNIDKKLLYLRQEFDSMVKQTEELEIRVKITQKT